MSFAKNMGSDISWIKTYNAIKNKHDEAFSAIDQAISLEEREKPNEAIEKYKEGIRLIDEALSVQVQCPETPDITWEKACVMIQKIKKTRAEVCTRINSIQGSPDFLPDIPPEDPPSYEEVMSSSEDEMPKTYKDLATALKELSIDPNENMQEEVIYTHDEVRLYFISPNGDVVSTQEPQILKISLVEGNEPNTPKAVLQIGTWLYPLVPGVSPCYRTDYGAFILPDLYSEIPGSSVGIILPSNADEELFDLLESILHGIISQPTGEGILEWRTRRRAAAPEDYSNMVSNKIVNGAWYVSQGLIKGAHKAGEFFNKTTPKIIDKMQSADRPADIPPTLSKSMQIAATATSKAARVTGFVADKVGQATVRLGHFLAPHIQKQGTRLLSSGFNMPEKEASDKVKSVLTVAAGAVEGFSTVYRGLETSAVILGTNLKENTVRIVGHRYGHPASSFTGDTLSTVGNVYVISQHARIITPKGFAKRAAKDAGTGFAYGYTTSTAAAAAASTSYSNSNESNKTGSQSSNEKSLNGIEKVAKKG